MARPFSFHVHADDTAYTPDGAPHPALDAVGYLPREGAVAGSTYFVLPDDVDPDERARRRLDAHAALLADGKRVTLVINGHSQHVAPAVLRPGHPLDTLVAWAAAVTRGLPDGGVCLLHTGPDPDGGDNRVRHLWAGPDRRILDALPDASQHAVFYSHQPGIEDELLELHAFPDPATGQVVLVSGNHGRVVNVEAPFAADVAPPIIRTLAHPDHAAAVTQVFWPHVTAAVDAYPKAALAYAEGHPDPIRADVTHGRLVVQTDATTPIWIIRALTDQGFFLGQNGTRTCAVTGTGSGDATAVLATLRQTGIPVVATPGATRRGQATANTAGPHAVQPAATPGPQRGGRT